MPDIRKSAGTKIGGISTRPNGEGRKEKAKTEIKAKPTCT